ncbi:MAG: hypothetical protein JXB30_11695 [Anaerolineae bacterium]|nr:hypothetical protein [Anaerolineae bacterium]
MTEGRRGCGENAGEGRIVLLDARTWATAGRPYESDGLCSSIDWASAEWQSKLNADS